MLYKNNVINNIFFIVISVFCFTISTISLLLPWSIRKMYLRFLEIMARIALKSKWVLQFVSKRAFAQETEGNLLLKDG